MHAPVVLVYVWAQRLQASASNDKSLESMLSASKGLLSSPILESVLCSSVLHCIAKAWKLMCAAIQGVANLWEALSQMRTQRPFNDQKRRFVKRMACSEQLWTMETWMLNWWFSGRSHWGCLNSKIIHVELCKYAESAQIYSWGSRRSSCSCAMQVFSNAVEWGVLPVKP